MKQSTSSKGTPFEFNNIFFVDDSVFITDNLEDLESLAPNLIQHFKWLGLQIHVGTHKTKSKTEAMFFPASLKEARELSTNGTLPHDITLPDSQHMYQIRLSVLGGYADEVDVVRIMSWNVEKVEDEKEHKELLVEIMLMRDHLGELLDRFSKLHIKKGG